TILSMCLCFVPTYICCSGEYHRNMLDVKRDAMNVKEFQKFYTERFEFIYRYTYSKIRNREEAEDLTSEIFLKAALSIDQQRSPQSMQYWLYLIACTALADYWRAYYREPKTSLDKLLEAGWEGPAGDKLTAMDSIPAQRVQRLLRTLPERYREVLTCR